jgi:hypothetical protein
MWQSVPVTTMADLDQLAMAMPQTTRQLSPDGRPRYLVHGKLFCCQRGRRPDAVDPDTGERMDDVLMFRVADVDVKELCWPTIAACSSPRLTSTATRPC